MEIAACWIRTADMGRDYRQMVVVGENSVDLTFVTLGKKNSSNSHPAEECVLEGE